MPYQKVLVLFWEQVKESIQEGKFAKLTMAKTIGKPNLKNIFFRPVYSDVGFKVLVKWSYRSKDSEDREEEHTIEEAYEIIKSNIRKPFLSVLLFTTEKDVTFKVNKKGIGSLSEKSATFTNVIEVKKDTE